MEKVLLLVDDEPSILRALKRFFHKDPYRILSAGSGYEALDIIREQHVDVLISDYNMPHLTGAELLSLARSIQPEMYSIVLSGNGDQNAVIESINDGGASKFISKPWGEDELREVVKEGFSIAMRRRYTLRIPGLLNQRHFLASLDDKLGHPYLSDYMLVYLQLQDVQNVRQLIGGNDEQHFFSSLTQSLNEENSAFTIGLFNDWRLGVFCNLSDASGSPTQIIDALLARFPSTIQVHQHQIPVKFSVGYAISTAANHNANAIVNAAALALNHAIGSATGNYVCFDRNLQSRHNRDLAIKSALPGALQRGEFNLVFQPKIRLADNAICGAEALLRWTHPVLGPVAPASFIPLAEETGTINPLGNWVMSRSLQQWATRGSSNTARLSVNVSPVQLAQRDFVNQVATALSQCDIKPECFELELTETCTMNDIEGSIALLREIRELGVIVSIDDFGTGYSSLNYLHRLPLDVLKIDRSFVQPIPHQKQSVDLIRHLIQIGRDMGIEIVAEGVETLSQYELLRSLGCDVVQGYYLSQPLALEDFVEFEIAHAAMGNQQAI